MTQFFKFQILLIYSSRYQSTIWLGFRAKSLELCEKLWFWAGEFFSLKNRFSILPQEFSPRSYFVDTFWKYYPQTDEWYQNPYWCAVSFQFSQVQVAKVVRMNQCSYYQIKYKQLSLFFKNTPKCQVEIKSYVSMLFFVKILVVKMVLKKQIKYSYYSLK